MSDTVILALITSVPPTLAGIAAVVVAFHTRRDVRETKKCVEVIEKQTNGMSLALLDVTAKASHAQGVLAGAGLINEPKIEGA